MIRLSNTLELEFSWYFFSVMQGGFAELDLCLEREGGDVVPASIARMPCRHADISRTTTRDHRSFSACTYHARSLYIKYFHSPKVSLINLLKPYTYLQVPYVSILSDRPCLHPHPTSVLLCPDSIYVVSAAAAAASSHYNGFYGVLQPCPQLSQSAPSFLPLHVFRPFVVVWSHGTFFAIVAMVARWL